MGFLIAHFQLECIAFYLYRLSLFGEFKCFISKLFKLCCENTRRLKTFKIENNNNNSIASTTTDLTLLRLLLNISIQRYYSVALSHLSKQTQTNLKTQKIGKSKKKKKTNRKRNSPENCVPKTESILSTTPILFSDFKHIPNCRRSTSSLLTLESREKSIKRATASSTHYIKPRHTMKSCNKCCILHRYTSKIST